MPELMSQDFVVYGHHVSLSYKNGDLVDVTVQEKDGTVLFSGNYQQLEALAHIGSWVSHRQETEG